MSVWFTILTVLFIGAAVATVLVILVQRPQGGGLAGAFGGAGGGTDTVFGGRVGDALTWATVIAFTVYLVLAVVLTRLPVAGTVTAANPPTTVGAPIDGTAPGTTDAPAGSTPTGSTPAGSTAPGPGSPAPGAAPGTAAPGAPASTSSTTLAPTPVSPAPVTPAPATSGGAPATSGGAPATPGTSGGTPPGP